MKKILVLFGNFTFHHFSPEEMQLFKNKEHEQKALLHSVDKVCHCSSKAELDNLIDELENSYEGWIVPSEFKGEIIFEPQPNAEIEKLFGNLE